MRIVRPQRKGTDPSQRERKAWFSKNASVPVNAKDYGRLPRLCDRPCGSPSSAAAPTRPAICNGRRPLRRRPRTRSNDIWGCSLGRRIGALAARARGGTAGPSVGDGEERCDEQEQEKESVHMCTPPQILARRDGGGSGRVSSHRIAYAEEMGIGTSIEWTEATWNPVTGCTKISPGCKHCY